MVARCLSRGRPTPRSLDVLRTHCAHALDVLRPLEALRALHPDGVPSVTAGLVGSPPAALKDKLARRVIAHLRAQHWAPLPDEGTLARVARVAARRGVPPLHACALPVLSPRWAWYDVALHEPPAWPELLLYAAATYDVDGYYAARDAAVDDARVDAATVRAIEDLNRRSWASSAKNSGNYFWTDRDRVDGRLRRPADIHRAVRDDRAGAFAARGLGDIPAYTAYVAGDTANFYLDVSAEEWDDYVADHLAWSATVLATAPGLWQGARRRRTQLRRVSRALHEPAVWPAFLQAYRATLDWCFGPGEHDL